MLTASDSLEIERIQMQALKTIFSWMFSYKELLAKSGLECLDIRREAAFLEFAKKASENPRFSSWFPRQLNRRLVLRHTGTNKLYSANTERYLKSPFNRMRRKLNELLAT